MKLPSVQTILSMTSAQANAEFIDLRWPDGVECPRCGGRDLYDYSPYSKFNMKWRCAKCRYQFTLVTGTVFTSNRMPIRMFLLAILFAERGDTAMKLAKVAGIQYKSAWSALGRAREWIGKEESEKKAQPEERKRINHYFTCDGCGERFLDARGDRTCDLKRGKTKHAFCTHKCARKYRMRMRLHDRCKRCNKTRKEISRRWARLGVLAVTFCNGYCPHCYALLRVFHYDEGLCEAHELNQTLKKETTHDCTNQKHRRSAEDAARIH